MAKTYKLIQGKTANEFEKRVNVALADGHELHEGHALMGGVHTQVVTKGSDSVPPGPGPAPGERTVKIVPFKEGSPYYLTAEDSKMLVVLECERNNAVPVVLRDLMPFNGDFPRTYKIAVVGELAYMSLGCMDDTLINGDQGSNYSFIGMIELTQVANNWLVNGSRT